MGEREGTAAGVIGGARGALPPVGGSKGPEPLASPNVLHWVGWLPGTTRCGAGPAVPRLARRGGAPCERGAGIGTIRPDRIVTTGLLSEPTIPVSPQGGRPAVSEKKTGPGGVSGCSGMPRSEKVQPARQSSRIQGARTASNAMTVSVSSWRRSTNGSRKPTLQVIRPPL